MIKCYLKVHHIVQRLQTHLPLSDKFLSLLSVDRHCSLIPFSDEKVQLKFKSSKIARLFWSRFPRDGQVVTIVFGISDFLLYTMSNETQYIGNTLFYDVLNNK